MDWNDLKFFLAVARNGSLAGAARELAVNATTVGRRLAVLEEDLGARLFDRTPDGHVLTAAGETLRPTAERVEAEFQALHRHVVGADQRLSGVVRVTMTEMIATRFVAPRMARFARRYPNISVEILCAHENLDLERREADIALRLSRPSQSSLVIKKIVDIELGLYVSTRYVEESGLPDVGAGLPGARIVAFPETPTWAQETAWLAALAPTARIVLRVDSASAAYAAISRGAGVGLAPRVIADRDDRLVRLETRSIPAPRPLWQVMHQDLKQTARIRVVADFLAEIFQPRDAIG